MTELLNLLQEGRAWSVEALAQRLNISPGQVKRQMEFLEELGYLRQVSTCSHNCSGCGAHCGMSDCHSGMPVFWEVIKKPIS